MFIRGHAVVPRHQAVWSLSLPAIPCPWSFLAPRSGLTACAPNFFANRTSAIIRLAHLQGLLC